MFLASETDKDWMEPAEKPGDDEIAYLASLTRAELETQFLQLKRDLALLEKGRLEMEAAFRENLELERQKSRKEKETLEKNAIDIFQAVGELSEEKTKAEHEKRLIESSALDIAQAVGELSQEKSKVEREKEIIEASAMDIAQAVGEISEEKTRLLIEKQLVESSAMDIIKNLTELSERQAEEIRASYVPAALPPLPPEGGDGKAALARAAEQVRLMRQEYTLLLTKIYPAHFLPVLERRESFQAPCPVTVLVVTIGDFYQHLIAMNPVRLSRFIKKLSSDLQGIVHQYSGWLAAYNHNHYTAVFGSPENPRAHSLEAVQAATELMAYGAGSGFKLSARLHTGPMVLGDFGSPERPLFHCLGELLAFLELMKRSETAHPGGVLMTEQVQSAVRYFFDTERVEPVSVKGHGVAQVYRMKGACRMPANPHRIEPGSFIAAKYAALGKEIAEKRARFFKGWNFEKIEVRDGSLGTGEALAFYALAFARENRMAVDEDLLVRGAFLLNLGKMQIPKAILNNPAATAAEKKLLANLYPYTQALLLKNAALRDVAELVADFRKDWDSVARPEAQALKVAAAFEGISFPKLYKTNVTSLKQAVHIFRNAYPHALCRKFLELMAR